MRIVYWSEPLWPSRGGVERLGNDLVRGLLGRGHEVIVVTECDGDPPYPVDVRRLPLRNVLDQRDLATLAKLRRAAHTLVAEARPDVLHFAFIGPGTAIGMEVARRGRVPFVVGVHGDPCELLAPGETLAGRLLRSADVVVPVSRAVADRTMAWAPGIEESFHIVPNGLDPAPFAPSPRPDDPPLLACAGRLVEGKGFDLAVEALARLRNGEARLAIAGIGPERPELERRARELGVADRVEWPGWLEPHEVRALLDRASIVLVPSRAEAFGIVALEAAFMARPVVTSGIGGLAEVVADGSTGIVVPPDDAAALAAAVETLIDDPRRADRMGIDARDRALADFGLDRCLDGYEAAYRKAMSGRAAGAAGHAAGDPSFSSLADGFARAAALHPGRVTTVDLTIAGRRVRLRVAGDRLADVLRRPLAHLVDDSASSEVDLAIDAWDAAETGVPVPPAAPPPGGRTWPLGSGSISASGDRSVVGYDRIGSRTWIQRAEGRLICAVGDARHLSLYERGKPFHLMLSVWLGDLGMQLIHAGLVARGGEGALLCGAGGSGKSNAALSCLEGGLTYLADDYVGLEELPDGSFVGHSLFGSGWLEAHDLPRFPRLAGHALPAAADHESKALVFPAAGGGALGRSAVIRALLLPRVAGGRASRARPATWGEAMLALGPSSILLLLAPGASGLERLARLARSVDRRWLELGEDRGTIAAAVAGVLEAAGTAPTEDGPTREAASRPGVGG